MQIYPGADGRRMETGRGCLETASGWMETYSRRMVTDSGWIKTDSREESSLSDTTAGKKFGVRRVYHQ